MLSQATTDASGRFSIRYTRSTSHSIFFVQADVSEGVKFVTVLGPSLPTFVTINELGTVAASYSMAQFYRTGVISGNSFGLQIAAGMNDNIVAPATGQSSAVQNVDGIYALTLLSDLYAPPLLTMPDAWTDASNV